MRTSQLPVKTNLERRDNEKILSSQAYWILKPPKRELLIFSSCQSNMAAIQTRTSHLLIKSNLEGRYNENFSSSHQVDWSLKPPKRELLIFSSCLTKMAAPQTRTSHLLIKPNIEGRDDENFSYSHQVNWSLKPPKQELLIFSSCLSKLAAPKMRTSHLLIKSSLEVKGNENFSYSHHVIWGLKPPKRELLIFSSCPLSFKLQLTWWEDEKFSLSLP